MAKKILLGIVIGSFFVYLSFKSVDLGAIIAGLESAKLPFIIPVLCLLVLIQILRSYRWGIIIKPILEIDQFSLLSATSVGFLIMISIPARIGELARPYLISTKTGISMSSAVGTVLVERVFDSLTVLTMFFIIVLFTPLPPWLIRSSIIFLLLILVFLGIMAFLILRKISSLNVLAPILKIFPEKWRFKLMEFIGNLIDGFKIILHRKSLCYLVLLSILIWTFDAVAIYILFFSFDLYLSLSEAMALMVIIILGIAIPTAPGFIGNWHFFCVWGLTLFGIHKTDALVYAIVLHFLSIGVIVILGLVFLPFNKFSLSDIKRRLSVNSTD